MLFRCSNRERALAASIIGTGNQNILKLHQIVDHFDLAENMIFSVNVVIWLLKVADVGVLSSHQEGFSNAI